MAVARAREEDRLIAIVLKFAQSAQILTFTMDSNKISIYRKKLKSGQTLIYL